MFKEKVADELGKLLRKEKGEILKLLEKPRYSNLGDIAFPCFDLAKEQKKNPIEIAMNLAQEMALPPKGIKKVQALGPYVNFFVDKIYFGKNLVSRINKQKGKYGSTTIGKGKKIVLEFSSPNIAKPMSIGHLRSTVIGNSLSHILSFMGYKCIKINYPGDYGTQFGKLLVAYKLWGKNYEEELKEQPIKTLLKLYVMFSQEAEKNKDLEDAARKEFKLLEEESPEELRLWKKFREISIKEFKEFYSILGITFDVYSGESLYSEAAREVATELERKKIAVQSAGAWIIQFPDIETPLIIKKSDGTTLYSTRDIAAARDRYKKYKFDQMVYVVASEQNLYFQQLFKTLKMVGDDWAEKCRHVNFGMIYMPEGKMSTRSGSIVFLEEVLDKIFELTKKFVEKSDFSEKQKEEIARAVGVSALIYGDLSNDRIKDIKFDWNTLLRLEGDSGPYIQYTYARAKSILRKSDLKKYEFDPIMLTLEEETLITDLSEFPYEVRDAADKLMPNLIANHISKLADHFNTFYEKCPVLKEDLDKKTKESRLALTLATAQVLKTGMELLGMIPLEKM